MSDVRSSRFKRTTKHSSTRHTAPVIRYLKENQDHLEHFVSRHDQDRNYIGDYDPNAPTKVRKHNDTQLDFGHYPSYSKFKVPFEMICRENYSESVKKYENQLNKEIGNLIDNQATAREATYFVRHVSYTTLWPPYHNIRELLDTSQKFYTLTPREKTRFDFIMSHNFSTM